ncbi:putrescine transport system ATP-binding protein [Pseudomonas sp. ok272]|uniref:ABC transporter ATP-binding protein n=1 Tax=unclassified Pseudomonas TaxID=196821 RepID=UPI0008D3A2AE|nr:MULTISPECIES: ABC transporter ATP-binding protein [unclassified Pseudomonas]SEM44749.1 putrescine transport system ATP-binding protein [Pseudomonas sp. ok272]SFM16585.1 putrescine transport system ATP-binding protein [Pseudomonas sp. ok602]
MNNASAVLILDKVSKSYGNGLAVDEVSLNIRENEFFALLGPSGCGKTTLLRMLAGFETPSSGCIYLDGQDISPLPANKRPLNLMFQSYALFPNMTVRKNIAYGLEMERLPETEIRQRVNEVLATAQLSELAERKPDQLSGGQRQRVALARALVKRPRVLLLDEPLGALDKKLREKMQLELKRLQHESGITFIIVTHDQEEALVMSDRMAVLDGGKVCQCGSPTELYENPNSRFVANFIGVSNLLEGVRAGEQQVTVNGHGLKVQTLPGAPRGEAVAVVVRPERLQVLGEQGGECDNQVEGQVVEAAYHGLDTNLHVKTVLSDKPLIVRVPSSQFEFAHFSSGMTVRLGWQARHARVLTH